MLTFSAFYPIMIVVHSAGGFRVVGNCFVTIFPQSALIDCTVLNRELLLIHIFTNKNLNKDIMTKKK